MFKTTWLDLKTKGRDQVVNITDQVIEVIKGLKVVEGTVNIFIYGSTASVTTIEYEPGLVDDLKELGERLAPSDKTYHHDQTWHDGNGHSHLRASAIGPSLTIPISEGEMTLGTWQQIVVIDHDVRSRERKVVVQVMGE